jgi:Zn-dependent protease
MNFFNQGLPLGKWFRITVVIHWTFLLYAANELFLQDRKDVGAEALFLFLLFGTVLMHEFGHALSCRAVGGEAYHIVLWPLGGIAFVQPPMNPWAWLVTTVCGPLVNAILWPVFWLLINHWPLPVPHEPGMLLTLDTLAFNSCMWMYFINRSLLLFNLIPAYPMDGGRLLQEVLWLIVGYARSMKIAGMVGTVAGGGLIVLGLGLYTVRIPVVNFTLGAHLDPMLAVIGLLCAMQSLAIYHRANEVQSWRKN